MFMYVYSRFTIFQTLAYVLIQIIVALLVITTNNIAPNSSQYDVFLSLI